MLLEQIFHHEGAKDTKVSEMIISNFVLFVSFVLSPSF